MTNSGGPPTDERGALLITTDSSGQAVSFEQICVLSSDDYARFKDAYKQIAGLVFGSIYTYFSSSTSLLRSAVMAANQASDVGLIQFNSAPDSFTTWLTSLRATALSLCSSVVYHQDQMLRRIEKAYGGKTPEYVQAKGDFGGLYDGYAGYRFLYDLRNVMVHESMEAVTAVVKQLLVDGEVRSTWAVTVDRSFIAQSDMKQPAKAQIVALTQNPNLLDLADEITQPLATVNEVVEIKLLESMSSAYQAVVEFDDMFGGKPGLRAIANSPYGGLGPHIPAYTPWSPQVIDLARSRLSPPGGD